MYRGVHRPKPAGSRDRIQTTSTSFERPAGFANRPPSPERPTWQVNLKELQQKLNIIVLLFLCPLTGDGFTSCGANHRLCLNTSHYDMTNRTKKVELYHF